MNQKVPHKELNRNWGWKMKGNTAIDYIIYRVHNCWMMLF